MTRRDKGAYPTSGGHQAARSVAAGLALLAVAACASTPSREAGGGGPGPDGEERRDRLTIAVPEDVGPPNIFASHEEPLTELVYDLSAYAGLLIPERLHRGLLERAADRILGLLEAGGTVIAFVGGEAAPEFLPGVRWEHRPTNYWWWLEPGAELGLRTPLPRALPVRPPRPGRLHLAPPRSARPARGGRGAGDPGLG